MMQAELKPSASAFVSCVWSIVHPSQPVSSFQRDESLTQLMMSRFENTDLELASGPVSS